MITNPTLLGLLAQWNTAQTELAKAKSEENRLRLEVAKLLFVAPVEGTQYTRLPAGYRLKMVHKINRSIDVALLPHAVDRLRKEAAINPDQYIDYKPVLKEANFRDASEVVKQIFANVVTEKPGTPSLEIVPPEKDWKDETGSEFYRWFQHKVDSTCVWATPSMLPPDAYYEIDEAQVPLVDRAKRQ